MWRREREKGVYDQERSTSQNLNLGRPEHNDPICWRAAHKAVGTDLKKKIYIYTLFNKIISFNYFFCIFIAINYILFNFIYFILKGIFSPEMVFIL